MVNFCNMCGQRLLDDKPCTCQQATQKNHNNFSPGGFSNSKVGVELLATKSIFLNFLKKPKSTIFEITKRSNYIPALIILGLEAILFALFATISFDRLISSYTGILAGKVDFIPTFIRMFILGIIQVPVFLLAIFAFCKVFRVDLSLNSVVSLVGVASIPYVLTVALSIIIGIIFPQGAVCMMIIGFIISFLLMYDTIKNYDKTEDENAIYLLPAAYFVYLIVMYMFMQVLLPKGI